MNDYYYCQCYNLIHYRQVAAGTGGWLSAASHESSGWLTNAEYEGGRDGR